MSINTHNTLLALVENDSFINLENKQKSDLITSVQMQEFDISES